MISGHIRHQRRGRKDFGERSNRMEIEYYLKPGDVVALHKNHAKAQGKRSSSSIVVFLFVLLALIIVVYLFCTENLRSDLWIGAAALVLAAVFFKPYEALLLRRRLRQGAYARALGWRR